jgi:hypothetical protein
MLSFERDYIIAFGVQFLELDFLIHTQIMEESIEHLSGLGTTDIVHARLEECITTTEALQTAAYLYTLF